MRLILVPIVALALAVGCDKGSQPTTDNSPAVKESPAMVEADNSAKNERDRAADKLTPMDQGESKLDRGITQQVRQNVMAEQALSTNAKNVKIVTVDGVVTLRGPVETGAEKSSIAALAKHVDGVKRVDNQLEVATK
jgi:osmotically-inducible protein OsmY